MTLEQYYKKHNYFMFYNLSATEATGKKIYVCSHYGDDSETLECCYNPETNKLEVYGDGEPPKTINKDTADYADSNGNLYCFYRCDLNDLDDLKTEFDSISELDTNTLILRGFDNDEIQLIPIAEYLDSIENGATYIMKKQNAGRIKL